MSTFSSWNGPGDFAGDLTLFYQSIRSVETNVNNLQAQITAITPKLESTGYNVPAGSSLQKEITQIETAVANLQTQVAALDSEWVKTSGVWKLEGGNADVLLGSLQATRLTSGEFFTSVFKTNAINITDGVDVFLQSIARQTGTLIGRLHSAVTVLLTAQKIQLNRIVAYDALEFRSQRNDHEYSLTSAKSPQDVPVDLMKNAGVAVTPMGEIIVGVLIEPDVHSGGTSPADLGLHAGGVATFYLSVRDTVNIEAVINVTAQWQHLTVQWSGGAPHGDEDVHGSLSVSFSYTAVPTALMQGLTFRLYHGTTYKAKAQDGTLLGTGYSQGAACIIVTCDLVHSGSTSAIRNNLDGDVFFVGKGVKRWESGRIITQTVSGVTTSWSENEDAINWGTLIEEVQSLPGDGVEAGCHGNLISGLRVNSLDVRYNAEFENNVRIDGALGVGKNSINLASPGSAQPGDLVVSGDTTLKGGLDAHAPVSITADPLDASKILTVQPDAVFNKDIYVQGEANLNKVRTDQIAPKKTTPDNPNPYLLINRDPSSPSTVKRVALGFESGTATPVNIYASGRPTLNKYADGTSVVAALSGTLALMEDVTAGVQMQGAYTAIMTQADFTLLNPGSMAPLTLQNGEKHNWEVGDAVLVKGYMTNTSGGGSDAWDTKVYTVTGITSTHYASFGAGVPLAPPPSRHDPSSQYNCWEYYGLQKLTNNGLDWSFAYAVFNPNINDGSTPAGLQGSWVTIDLHLEYYRPIPQQDVIDRAIAHLGSIQPDWLADDPVLDFDNIPGSPVAGKLPNPAYINNKPWLLPTIMDGGDWSAPNAVAYDNIIEGGDWSDAFTHPPVVPPFQAIQSQTPVNAITKLSHGPLVDRTSMPLVSLLPPASPITAYMQKVAYESNTALPNPSTPNHIEIYLDLGDSSINVNEGDFSYDTVTGQYPHPIIRQGNLLVQSINL